MQNDILPVLQKLRGNKHINLDLGSVSSQQGHCILKDVRDMGIQAQQATFRFRALQQDLEGRSVVKYVGFRHHQSGRQAHPHESAEPCQDR